MRPEYIHESVLKAEARFLQDLEEGISVLEAVNEQDGFTLAQFRGFSLLLPPELKQRLSGSVGHRVGILRIDGAYKIRVDHGR